MGAIAKLLGGTARTRVLRLFVLNPQSVFESREVAQRTKTPTERARAQLAALHRIGIVKRRVAYKEALRGHTAGKRKRKRRTQGWTLDTQFPHLDALHDFLLETMPRADHSLVRRLRRGGKLTLVVAAGTFVHDTSSRVDLLIVADQMHHRHLEAAIKELEAEMGKEVHFTALSTDEFYYRTSMHDRLIRDIFDAHHRVLLDRLGFSEQNLTWL